MLNLHVNLIYSMVSVFFLFFLLFIGSSKWYSGNLDVPLSDTWPAWLTARA